MKKKAGMLKKIWRDRTLVLMTLPAVTMLIMFKYIPMTGLVLAFKKFDYRLGLYGSPWVGFENFRYLFMVGDTFWRVTRNTVLYYIAFTILGIILETSIAIAIDKLVFKRMGKVLQSVMILPTFISWVAVSFVTSALLEANSGVITRLVMELTGKNINFYLEAKYWPVILVIVNAWKTAGYGSILYLSVITGIDQELYEAAAIDGATSWQKTRYITIPALAAMVGIKTLLGLGNIMSSDTGLFYQTTKNVGALYRTTQVWDSYLLNAIQENTNYGATSAATLFQSIVGFVMVVVVNSITRKVAPESAIF